MNDIRWVAFKGDLILITRGPDGLFRSNEGTIWAFPDDGSSVDAVDRCGIGLLSLPANDPLTDACRPHDYMYSSPAFQVFHTRSEADEWLEKNIEIVGEGSWRSWLAVPFQFIARVFGSAFWENDSTNN